MFAPEGWITFREVYFTIQLQFDSYEELGGKRDITGEEAFEFSWMFAADASKVCVCTLNGVIFEADRSIVYVFHPGEKSNGIVHLYHGTVGSGMEFHETQEHERQYRLERSFGPFLHLPIIFPRADFEQFLRDLQGAHEESEDQQDNSPSATAKKILTLYAENSTITYKIAKAQIGPEQSERKFRFAWDLAKQKQPLLAKPGRRPVRQNS